MVKKQSNNNKKESAKQKNKFVGKLKKTKIKDKVMFDIPHYPQTEEFTSSAACAMMILKYIDPDFKFKKENEYSIWQEAVNGSVWHGSKYGIAYALSKRGAKVGIVSNTKDEGYDKNAFYINDPYSDSTVTIDPDAFKAALGFDSNYHMVFAHSRRLEEKK